MAKQIKKSSVKALETTAAKIGDNSEVALSASAKAILAKIGKCGTESRAGAEIAGKKQLEAVKLFADSVRENTMTAEQAVEAAKAYNPTAEGRMLINLTGDFKSFALPAVLKAADYSLVTGATKGKSHFQSCMAINRAIVRAVKGTDGKVDPKAKLPTVNAAFVKAALEYSSAGGKADLKSAKGRKDAAKAALKRLADIAGDLKAAVIKGATENAADFKLSKAQLATLAKVAELFA